MISTMTMEPLDLANFPLTEESLGGQKFSYGDIVCERYCRPEKRIPFKITGVIKPNPAKGFYFKGYEYKLEAVFMEDAGAILHNNPVPAPECMLMDFEEAKEDIIGALLSKAKDIKQLNRETL